VYCDGCGIISSLLTIPVLLHKLESTMQQSCNLVSKEEKEEEEEIRVECSLQDAAARPELCSFVASQSPAPAAPFRSRVKSQSGLR
jgi:hypothetical protein